MHGARVTADPTMRHEDQLIVTRGDVVSAVSTPAGTERSFDVHVCAPTAVAGAVAPGPLDARDPYCTVSFAVPASVTPETVIVRPEIVAAPVLTWTNPGAVPVPDGALQPLGTTIVTDAPDTPPDAAV